MLNHDQRGRLHKFEIISWFLQICDHSFTIFRPLHYCIEAQGRACWPGQHGLHCGPRDRILSQHATQWLMLHVSLPFFWHGTYSDDLRALSLSLLGCLLKMWTRFTFTFVSQPVYKKSVCNILLFHPECSVGVGLTKKIFRCSSLPNTRCNDCWNSKVVNYLNRTLAIWVHLIYDGSLAFNLMYVVGNCARRRSEVQ